MSSRPAARVYTIPPGVGFADALAAGLLKRAGDEPFALVDATILLPTRRAVRTLRTAFLRAGDGRALLLPRLLALGDVGEEMPVLAGSLEFDLPPAIGPLRRQLLLARLVRRGPALAGTAAHMSADQAVRLAEALGRLLDEFQAAEVPLDRLDGLVPERFAEHWQRTRRFLAILADHWPGVLAEEGAADPAARQALLLDRLGAHWRERPPAGAVVVAGVTATTPALRRLMRAIAALERGAVVLPGLVRGPAATEPRDLPPTHPQHALGVILHELGVTRADVADWPGRGTESRRASWLSAAMRPAGDATAAPALLPAGLDGLRVQVCPDAASEAAFLAAELRAALERPRRTAALVTPDRRLARRVAAELRRFGLDVDDSGGIPLDQTPPGGFLLLCAHLALEGAHPIALLAALKHPLARGGTAPERFRGAVRRLERQALRGPRVLGSLAGLRAELERRRDQKAAEGKPAEQLSRLAELVAAIAAAAEPLAELARANEAPLGELVRRHVAFTEWLARGPHDGAPSELWAREAGEAVRDLVAELAEAGDAAGPVEPAGYPALLATLMAQRAVRPRRGEHPRLAILGVLEARLQQPDLVLLAGLNEGVWPAEVEPGPWLSGAMRTTLGLPAPEARIGLAAHDFMQLACAPEVVLTRAEKDGDGRPTVPSRWLERLRVLLQAHGMAEGERSFDARRPWAAEADLPAAHEIRLEPRAAFAPPLEARPRRLSISDVETWTRDPYGLYAKRVLRLRQLDPLDADPGAADRGELIHEVLAAFVRAEFDPQAPDVLAHLLDLGRAAFRRFDHMPQVRALWWPRFERVAAWFVQREAGDRDHLVRSLVETEGRMVLDGPGGPFELYGRADRIDVLATGDVRIVDYKTGSAPSQKEVDAGYAPQLPLEAAIAAAGGFGDLEPSPAAALQYWRLSGGREPAKIAEATKDVAGTTARTMARLDARIRTFDSAASAYQATPYPPKSPRYNPYVHLERVAAWREDEAG